MYAHFVLRGKHANNRPFTKVSAAVKNFKGSGGASLRSIFHPKNAKYHNMKQFKKHYLPGTLNISATPDAYRKAAHSIAHEWPRVTEGNRETFLAHQPAAVTWAHSE